MLPVGGGRWMFAHRWYPERGESPADYTPERCVELLRIATGLPRLRPRILGVTRVHHGRGAGRELPPRSRFPGG